MGDPGGPWGQAPAPASSRPRRQAWLWPVFVLALVGLVTALMHAYPQAIRSPQDWASLAARSGLVVLVCGGMLRAGRVFERRHLGHLALWAVIIAALALGFAYRGELKGVGQRLQMAFGDGAPVVTGERELAIPQAENGGYEVIGSVNGQRVRFVVDTGASDTVLSPDDARRAGIDPATLRYVLESETANGVGYGAPANVDLAIGPIIVRDFAVTVNQAPMRQSLLGMTFLRRLESVHAENGQLVLRWRDSPPQRQP